VNDSTRRLYGHVAADRAAAVGLPRDVYLDPAVFDAELARVFETGWLPVARTSTLGKPGDYRSVDLAGVPLVVSRDERGALHVLSRVCRHRGMPVVDGSGNRKDFSCPYHLWRYGLDGRFLFAPAMDGAKAFDASKCGLPCVAHEEWGGWIFANISGSAAPLTRALQPLTERLRRVDPAQYVTAATLEFDSPWNWKIMVENFLESYHHIGPHANTLQRSNPGFGTYATDDVGTFTILENPGIDASPSFVVACVFPWTLIAITETEIPFGVWYEFDRVRHDRFLLRIHLLLVPEQAADVAFVAYLTEQIRVIHVEDIAVCDGVQRGLRSPLYASGPLSRLEGCLWHFHRYLQRCFAAP
jgi:phenylpropionate dioxygenase-like ring-hydroxylating dioxygenase large terminal subunit